MLDNETFSELKTLCTKIWNDHVDISDCEELDSDSLLKVESFLTDVKSKLASESRTARLWLNYMYYVEVIKFLVAAERTGNWSLHLYSVQSMLNLFAAAGHSNYAKSARLYVQIMRSVPESLADQFAKGFDSIRLSDRQTVVGIVYRLRD